MLWVDELMTIALIKKLLCNAVTVKARLCKDSCLGSVDSYISTRVIMCSNFISKSISKVHSNIKVYEMNMEMSYSRFT